jgi:hypothetical protein
MLGADIVTPNPLDARSVPGAGDPKEPERASGRVAGVPA